MKDRKPRVGLLPLYLELYDERVPGMRAVLEPFLARVADGLGEEGLDCLRAPVCRLNSEFEEAVASFEAEDADCIVTLHLAYSPSLESADTLARTSLPIVILDTTMDHEFGTGVSPDRISYNHGIHGVQDMASVLRRRGKPFAIAAGHVSESDVLRRAADMARAARAARRLGSMKVLRIGESFSGMGDFAVAEDVLKRVLGVTVEQIGVHDLAARAAIVTDDDIEEEMARDRERFEIAADEACHRRSVRVGLVLRRLLEERGYGAFSMNFLAFGSAQEPIDTVPFLEASKAMERGLGYAGEGDVLTASVVGGLVGALGGAFGETTFTEMFCPDWKGNSIFLSHMGEINPAVAAAKPRLCEKPFPYTPAHNPAVLACALRPGPAVLVNIAPGPEDTFTLLVAPVEVLEDADNPAMRSTIRGWIRPRRPVAEFLEDYSRHGGTHHCALVFPGPRGGDLTEALEAFAMFAGLGFHRL